ncbi:MAG: hypothetical protein H0U10_12370 [Chloroflexia bacterium]|nr:hypothetical protein [Chloroflexia bacterium]
MSFLQRLFGGSDEPQRQPQPRRTSNAAMSDDERALARYRYMLQSAPPETLEQAHAEAFAGLTPEQRQMVLQGLAEDVPASERSAYSDDPRSLARMATRAEMRQPGTLERRFGGMGGGMGGGMPGMGSMMAGSFLSTIAGVMVGSAIANAFMGDSGYSDETGGADGGDGGDAGADGDMGGDVGADGGGDFGGDVGGGGFGDFGGGDFGGGDFGGGDF